MKLKPRELKPCPFCGSNNVSLKRYSVLYGVECDSCYQPSWPYYPTVKTAVTIWNEKYHR